MHFQIQISDSDGKHNSALNKMFRVAKSIKLFDEHDEQENLKYHYEHGQGRLGITGMRFVAILDKGQINIPPRLMDAICFVSFETHSHPEEDRYTLFFQPDTYCEHHDLRTHAFKSAASAIGEAIASQKFLIDSELRQEFVTECIEFTGSPEDLWSLLRYIQTEDFCCAFSKQLTSTPINDFKPDADTVPSPGGLT